MRIHSCKSDLCFQQLCNLYSVGVLSDVPGLKLAGTDLHREQIQEFYLRLLDLNFTNDPLLG